LGLNYFRITQFWKTNILPGSPKRFLFRKKIGLERGVVRSFTLWNIPKTYLKGFCPFIKKWLPGFYQILSPKELSDELKEDLRRYLNG